MLQTSTLRPGLLVSLKTSITGNVRYLKNTIEADHVTEGGTLEAKWETHRTISDPKEHEEAVKVRSKAGNLIRSICANSAFGLLCPEIAADKLESAIVEARKLAEEFNARATLTRLKIYVITGRIAQDDVEAVRSINSEVRDLMADMERGLKNLDVKVVRDAANKAKQIGSMLSPYASTRLQMAIDAARTAARDIVKASEQGAATVDLLTIAKITECRTDFLDLDDNARDAVAPEAESRAMDFEPVREVKTAEPESRTVDLESPSDVSTQPTPVSVPAIEL